MWSTFDAWEIGMYRKRRLKCKPAEAYILYFGAENWQHILPKLNRLACKESACHMRGPLSSSCMKQWYLCDVSCLFRLLPTWRTRFLLTGSGATTFLGHECIFKREMGCNEEFESALTTLHCQLGCLTWQNNASSLGSLRLEDQHWWNLKWSLLCREQREENQTFLTGLPSVAIFLARDKMTAMRFVNTQSRWSELNLESGI